MPVTALNYTSKELSFSVSQDLGDLKRYKPQKIWLCCSPTAPGCMSNVLDWKAPTNQRRSEGVLPTRVTPHKHCAIFMPTCFTIQD